MKKSTICYWTGSKRTEATTCPLLVPCYKKKAMQIAKALDLQPEEFKASNGWLDHLKNRNGNKGKIYFWRGWGRKSRHI